jgi:hypothetical protein
MQIKVRRQIIFSALSFISVLGSTAAVSAASSGDISWSETRLSANTLTFTNKATALNNLTAADKVTQLAGSSSLRIEQNAHLGWLKAGLRGTGVWSQLTSPSTSNADGFLALQQGQMGVILRLPILETNLLRFDIFGEAGLESTHIDVSTKSSGSGTFTKNFSPYERAGATFGLGWKEVHIFVEGGKEWNKLTGVSFAGNLTNSIAIIDLGGMYVGAGLIFSGVPSWIKK